MAEDNSESPTQFAACINKLTAIIEKIPRPLYDEVLAVWCEFLNITVDREEERQESDKKAAQAFASLQNRLKNQEEAFLKVALAREEERKAHSKYIEEMALLLQTRIQEQDEEVSNNKNQ
jgi:mannitol-1-phosphate/altronate dehydrogenase